MTPARKQVLTCSWQLFNVFYAFELRRESKTGYMKVEESKAGTGLRESEDYVLP